MTSLLPPFFDYPATNLPLMVRSGAAPRVSNHETILLPFGSSFETRSCGALLRMRADLLSNKPLSRKRER
jgi:hypothetical protein